MLYVVLATFAAGMSTEYFLGNRWIGFFRSRRTGLPVFFLSGLSKTCSRKKKEEEEKRAKRKERKQQHK